MAEFNRQNGDGFDFVASLIFLGLVALAVRRWWIGYVEIRDGRTREWKKRKARERMEEESKAETQPESQHTWESDPLPWFAEVLGLNVWPVTEATLRTTFRARAKEVHPDVGGAEAEFVWLHEARNAALDALRAESLA